MFDVGLIVLGEVAIYYATRNEAARGSAEEAEREAVIRVYLLAPKPLG